MNTFTTLAIPQKILDAEGLVGGLMQLNGSRPLTLHLPYANLMSIGGDSAPRLFHLLLSMSLLVAVGQVEQVLWSNCRIRGHVFVDGQWRCRPWMRPCIQQLTHGPLCTGCFRSRHRRTQSELAIAAVTLSCKYSAAALMRRIFWWHKCHGARESSWAWWPYQWSVHGGCEILLRKTPSVVPLHGMATIAGAEATENMQFFF